MGFGQTKYDITQPQLTITLDDPNPVPLPPVGNEFSTQLAHGLDFDDNGGQTGVIRYTGAAPALVQLDCTMSFERLPGSFSQHLFLGWSVGQPPTLATVSPDTRQETDLAFDEQDVILNIQGAFVMQPGDVAQVWIRRTDQDPEDVLLFKVTGFMLTAQVVGGGVAPSAGSRANLVFDPGEPSSSFVLPDGPAAKLPPLAEFKTNITLEQDYIKVAEGSLKYTGQQAKVQRISGTITVERDQGLDSDVTLFVNVAAAPADGTKDLPTSQSYRVNVSDQSDLLHVDGLFAVNPQDMVQLWSARTPGASPFKVKISGYSLTITDA